MLLIFSIPSYFHIGQYDVLQSSWLLQDPLKNAYSLRKPQFTIHRL